MDKKTLLLAFFIAGVQQVHAEDSPNTQLVDNTKAVLNEVFNKQFTEYLKSNKAKERKRAVTESKKLYSNTIDLLEELSKTNDALIVFAEQSIKLSEIAEISNPTDVSLGYDFSGKFNSSLSNLIESKDKMIDANEQSRLKQNISGFIDLMKSNFPIVNTVSSAISVLASYTSQDIYVTSKTFGGASKVDKKYTQVFTGNDIQKVIDSFHNDFVFYGDLNKIQLKYRPLMEAKLAQVQSTAQDISETKVKLYKLVASEEQGKRPSDSSINQYFSNLEKATSTDAEMDADSDSVKDSIANIQMYSQDAIQETLNVLDALKSYDPIMKNYYKDAAIVIRTSVELGANKDTVQKKAEKLDSPSKSLNSIFADDLKRLKEKVRKFMPTVI